MSYWLDAARRWEAKDKAQKLEARLIQEGADLRGVILIDKARADRLAARMEANRPSLFDDGNTA